MGHTNDFAPRNWRELRQRSITPAVKTLLIMLATLALPANAMASDAIIVKRAPGLDRDERLAVRADADVKLTDMLTLPDTEVVVPRDGDVDEALEALNANPDVVYAEPDTPVRLQSNDPLFGNLYGLENTGQTIWDPGVADADLDAPEAWLRTRGAGAVVAVVDTGFEVTHTDLAGQFTGNPGERGAGKEPTGSTTTATASSMTGRAGTSCTTTARSRPRTTSTGPMSPERSRRPPTTESASPVSRRWRRSCRSRSSPGPARRRRAA